MKLFLRPCLLFFSFLFLARAHAQLTVFGGPQITSAKYLIRNVEQQTSSKQGFLAGVGLKSLIEGPAYFTPMLFFSQKGYKVSFDRPAYPPDSAAKNNNTTIRAIELAPLVQFNLSKKANYVYLRVGPSADFNISGRESFDSTGNKRITRNMPFDFGGYSYVTLSANVHLGFQHQSGFTAFAFYQYGLSSLNNADYGPEIYHRVGGIALGYKFGKKK